MSERIAKWDNAKFLLILLVVVGHLWELGVDTHPNLQGPLLFIYSFHMPLFIFVSGLFSKHTVNSEKLDIRKILPYFIIAFLMKIVFCIAKGIIYGNFQLTMFTERGVPWYLISIGTWMIVTHYIRKIDLKYVLIFSIILGCFVNYDDSIGADFCISRIIVYYPYFLAGYYMRADKVLEFTRKKWVKITSAVLIAAGVAVAATLGKNLFFVRQIFTGQNPFENLDSMENYGVLIRLACYAVSILIGFSFLALVPEKKTFFTGMGSRTLQVYALHYIPMYVLDYFKFPNVMSGIPGYMVIFFFISVAVTILLSVKPLEKPFNYLLRPKARTIE